MSYELFMGLLFWGWVILEIYLGWINYKGCFRYKLLEGSKLWRKVDERLGVRIRIIISPFLVLLIFLALSALMVALSLSIEIALISVFSGMFIITLENVIYDRESVGLFEKYCLRCESKKECLEFLDKHCKIDFFKHRVRMATTQKRNT